MSNYNTKDVTDINSTKGSNVHRALIIQGGGSLGAYEAGAYKVISEELSVLLKNTIETRKNENKNLRYFISFLELQLVQ